MPGDPSTVRRLIRFFELEKALYEIQYDLANRPGWASIPAAGVLDLVDLALNPLPGNGDAA